MSYFFIDIFEYELISDGSLRILLIMMLDKIDLHYGWIKSTMHANNHFFPSAVFAHLSPSLIKISTAKFPWNKTDKKPTLTGITPHVTI